MCLRALVRDQANPSDPIIVRQPRFTQERDETLSSLSLTTVHQPHSRVGFTGLECAAITDRAIPMSPNP